jgi:hypothetical protein
MPETCKDCKEWKYNEVERCWMCCNDMSPLHLCEFIEDEQVGREVWCIHFELRREPDGR